MKANRFAAAPDGVSSVVSAVLLFSLFSTAFLLWTVTQLPVWIEDREVNHAASVRQDLGDLQASLEQMASNGNPGPITQRIAMGPAPIPVLQGTPSLGTLSIEDAFNLTGTFTDPFLHVLGTTAAGTPTAGLGTSMTDVDGLSFLFMDYRATGVSNNQYAFVRMTATDGTDSVIVEIIQTDANTGAYARSGCGDGELRVEVQTGATASHVLQCNLDQDVLGYRINLLDDDLGIEAALGDLDEGYSITWTTGGSSGDTSGTTYAAVWQDTDGMTQVAGNGMASSYGVDEDSKVLAFDTNSQHATQQDLVWTGGAVAVAQGANMAITGQPTFDLRSDGNQGALRWVVVVLDGDGSMSGGGDATVTMRHTGTRTAVLTCDDATLTVEGPHATAWRNHMQDEVLAHGVADVTVGGSGDTATLQLQSGTVTSWTIHLTILEAELTLS